MKKILPNALIIAILITSCGKTTKGKVANDWKVSSYNEVYTNIDDSGDHSTETVSIDETTYNVSINDNQFNFDYTKSGSVAYNNYIIKKDGTWSSESEVNYVSAYNPISQKSVTKTSGTWSFIGKTKGDDFKKNERIIFNILSESFEVTGEDEPLEPSLNAGTYLTGEKSTIYSISKSTGKELHLELTERSTWLDEGEIFSGTRSIKIVLKK